MPPNRLTLDEVDRFLRIWDPEVRRISLELRRIVFRQAPQACEKIAFHVLSYYVPDRFLGSIGGNICLISPEDDHVSLQFILGVKVKDPQGLLKGKQKSKRHLIIRTLAEAKRPAIAQLIRDSASVAERIQVSDF